MDGELTEMLLTVATASIAPIALPFIWQMLRRTKTVNSSIQRT